MVKDKKLKDELNIPSIIFGSQILVKDSSAKSKALRNALESLSESGITAIDTSPHYGIAERCIGDYLKEVNRENYTLITKVSNLAQRDRNIRRGLEASLKNLNTDYLDCYLLHWPVPDYFLASWKELEKIYEEGLCKYIGVCNCNIHHLNEIESICNYIPMINEVECHPLFTQRALRQYCKDQNIKLFAYTAIARMDERMWRTCIPEIAKKYGKTSAQIIIKWHQQIGNIPIVSSTNPVHIFENANVLDFELKDDEIEMIETCNINSRLRYDPDSKWTYHTSIQ